MIDQLIAGDTLDFDVHVQDPDGNEFLASAGWSMQLRILPRTSGTPYSISATASGDDFNVAASASTTASWAPGNYNAVALVSKSGERRTVYLGEVVIKPDPGQASTYDLRSSARIALDAARAAHEDYVTNRLTVAEYEIAGRRMKFRSAADLVELIEFYQRKVAEEEVADRLKAGLSSGRKLFTRFVQ